MHLLTDEHVETRDAPAAQSAVAMHGSSIGAAEAARTLAGILSLRFETWGKRTAKILKRFRKSQSRRANTGRRDYPTTNMLREKVRPLVDK